MNTLSEELFKYSKLESRRFNKRIFRGLLKDIDYNKILTEIFNQNVDVAIFRIPTTKMIQFNLLNKIKIPYIFADILIYFFININMYNPNNLRNESLNFVECTLKEKGILTNLVREIFPNYKNHYASNPFFKPEDILEGYIEWACNHITSINKKCICWLIKIKDSFVGFATCVFEEDKKQVEISLVGVDNMAFVKFKALGIYDDIVRFIQRYFKEKGYKKIITSTQSHNLSVQRILIKEGFNVKNIYNTIHLNCLTDYSDLPKLNFQVTLTQASLKKFIESSNSILFRKKNRKFHSNDNNLINFILVNMFTNQFIENNMSVKAIEVLGYQYNVLNSIRTNKNYKISINLIKIPNLNNVYKSLLTVKNEKNQLCLYSYIDLKIQFNV